MFVPVLVTGGHDVDLFHPVVVAKNLFRLLQDT